MPARRTPRRQLQVQVRVQERVLRLLQAQARAAQVGLLLARPLQLLLLRQRLLRPALVELLLPLPLPLPLRQHLWFEPTATRR